MGLVLPRAGAKRQRSPGDTPALLLWWLRLVLLSWREAAWTSAWDSAAREHPPHHPLRWARRMVRLGRIWGERLLDDSERLEAGRAGAAAALRQQAEERAAELRASARVEGMGDIAELLAQPALPVTGPKLVIEANARGRAPRRRTPAAEARRRLRLEARKRKEALDWALAGSRQRRLRAARLQQGLRRSLSQRRTRFTLLWRAAGRHARGLRVPAKVLNSPGFDAVWETYQRREREVREERAARDAAAESTVDPSVIERDRAECAARERRTREWWRERHARRVAQREEVRRHLAGLPGPHTRGKWMAALARSHGREGAGTL